MTSFRKIKLLVPLLAAVASSCSPSSVPSWVKRTTSASENKIMFVSQESQTLGYRRLSAFSALYPDLQDFLREKGSPDFLAETTKTGNRYLILYYLTSRKAFACRSEIGNSRQVEFSGPYPISDKEFSILNSLRDRATSGRR